MELNHKESLQIVLRKAEKSLKGQTLDGLLRLQRKMTLINHAFKR